MTQTQQRRPTMATIDILRKLIGFETVSRNSNMELIQWVQNYLAEHGIESHISQGDDKQKANLFATLNPGQGDPRQGGIVLSGHSDVVPIDGQNWNTAPFVLTEQDGKFFGRGTCDMKGFIAVVLGKVPILANTKRVEPIHIALSFDEEIGCKGVHHLINDLKKKNIQPRGCIIGEPTSMKTIVGHKCGTAYTGTVEGLEIHSSLAPQGVNAVEYASFIIVKICEIANRLENEERRHDGYEVPYSTLQTGVVEGGHASNIVPAICTFRFDIRTLPWTDPEDIIEEINTYAQETLIPKMRKIHPEANISITLKGRVPGFAIAEDAPLTRYVQKLSKTNTAPGYVTFGSEAGLFQSADIPSIICGPGSISQAHKPNEFVSLDQLAQCEVFMDQLADNDFLTD